MAISRIKKEKVVKELSDNFANAQISVFTDYKGMNVKALTALRRKIKINDGLYTVAKKTLVNKALEAKKVEGLNLLNTDGQLGIGFGFNDAVSVSKVIYDSYKETQLPKILSGIMEGRVLTGDEIIQFAKLPSRQELLTKVVGSINAPVSGFVNVLSGTLRGFIYALNAISSKKS